MAKKVLGQHRRRKYMLFTSFLMSHYTPYEAYLAAGLGAGKGVAYTPDEKEILTSEAHDLARSPVIGVIRQQLESSPERLRDLSGKLGVVGLMDLATHAESEEVRRKSLDTLYVQSGLAAPKKNELHVTGHVDLRTWARLEILDHEQLAVRAARLLDGLRGGLPGVRDGVPGARAPEVPERPVVLHRELPGDEGRAGPGEPLQAVPGPGLLEDSVRHPDHRAGGDHHQEPANYRDLARQRLQSLGLALPPGPQDRGPERDPGQGERDHRHEGSPLPVDAQVAPVAAPDEGGGDDVPDERSPDDNAGDPF